MVSLDGGATLNPKNSNPKPNSNLLLFPPRPWEPNLGFHVKTHLVLFFFFFSKFSISVVLVGSHTGENLETGFQPGFHPKWEQLILNGRTGLRTGSPTENCPTLVQTLPSFNLLVFSSMDHISKEANSLKVSNTDGDGAMWPHQHPVFMDSAHSHLNKRWQTLQRQ
jgi:hypothetical protein